MSGLPSLTGFASGAGGGGSGAEVDVMAYSASVTPDLDESGFKTLAAVNATAATWTLEVPSGAAENFMIEVTNDGTITFVAGAGVTLDGGSIYDTADNAVNLLCCSFDGTNMGVGIRQEGADPFIDFVEALIHFDDDLTTEVTGRTVTEAAGTAVHDTTVKKFGAGSMLVSAGITSGEGVSVAEGAGGLDMAAEFTVEGWFRTTATTGRLFTWLGPATAGIELQLLYNNTNMQLDRDGGGPELTWTLPNSGLDVRDGAFHHMAFTRDAINVCRFFFDGVLIAGGGVFGATISPTEFNIGYLDGFDVGWDGNIDECRLTVGVVRYIADFTVPASPFPDA